MLGFLMWKFPWVEKPLRRNQGTKVRAGFGEGDVCRLGAPQTRMASSSLQMEIRQVTRVIHRDRS